MSKAVLFKTKKATPTRPDDLAARVMDLREDRICRQQRMDLGSEGWNSVSQPLDRNITTHNFICNM